MQKEYEIEKEFIKMEISNNEILTTSELKEDDHIDQSEMTCGAESEPIEIKFKKSGKALCYKCKKNKSNYLNRTEFICKECFTKNLNHKFRSNLRAHCKIRHEDYVLVCISGGNNSMAMLHWFYATFNDNTSHRKLFFKLKVLHVDDSLLYKLDSEYNNEKMEGERLIRKKTIEDICKNYGFDFEVINLESFLNVPIFNLTNNEENNENNFNFTDETLINKFLNFYINIPKTGSLKEDYLKIMTRNVIFNFALQNNFNKIVFADTAQLMVNNIFNQVIKGRGYSIREDIGYIDNHFLDGRINILKPMRDFLTKEILLYNHINNVNLLYSPLDLIKDSTNKVLGHHLPYQGDTHLLVKFFFDNLQDKMSSTVTTVMGTAEKLKFREKCDHKTCQFCLNFIDELYNELEIGSIDSINNDKIFSHPNLCFGCKRLFQTLQDREDLLAEIPMFYKNYK